MSGPIYISGDFTVPVSIDGPEFTAPFPGVNIDYVLKQKFQQLLAYFVPEDLNTPHPDPAYSEFLLVEESEKVDIKGTICEWTRTYAKPPAQYSQPSSFPYNFIGYVTGGGAFTILGRNRFTETVAARIQYDYFLLDEASGNIYNGAILPANIVYTGSPSVLPDVLNIPVLPEQQYFQAGINSVWAMVVDDFIGYGPSAAIPQTNYPSPPSPPVYTPGGGNNYWLPPYEAYPTREVYESWIKQTATVQTYVPDQAQDVAGVLTDTHLYEIVAQASRLERWLGNYVQRTTTYIYPK